MEDCTLTMFNSMNKHGLNPGRVIADGQFHRFGPKKSHWYIAHVLRDYTGKDHWIISYGDWRTGLAVTKTSRAKKQWSKQEQDAARDAIEKIRIEQERAKIENQKAVAAEARYEFNSLIDFGKSPYFDRKLIDQNYGAKVDSNLTAFIPMQDGSGEIIGVQKIYPDGSKYFYTGQKVTGGFHVIGNATDELFYLVEGFATGVSVHKATGKSVIVAFNAGNLIPVAEHFFSSGKKIIVCADNDQFTEAGNVGIQKAQEVKNRFGFNYVIPSFKSLDSKPTDFNDLEILEGLARVSEIINPPRVIQVVQSASDIFTIDEEITEETTKQTALAEFLARASKDRVFYDYRFDRWWVFDGIWKQQYKVEIEKRVIAAMKVIIPDGFSYSFFSGVFRLFQPHVSKLIPEFDPRFIPFKNGYLDLKTKNFLPHSVEKFFDWHIPCDYSLSKETPTCDEVFHNLAGGDLSLPDYDSKIKILKCFLAATVRGMSHLQKYLELIGESGAGKSTYMNLAMMLVGEQNCHSSSLRIFHKSSWETSMMLGKRLVVFPDENEFGGAGDILKSASGGDTLRYEPKGKTIGSSFIYRGMIIISANNYIQFSDKSNALVRRRIPIEIQSSVPEEKRDHRIMEKLRAEIPALINQLLDISEDEIEWTLSLKSGLYAKESVNSFVQTNLVALWVTERCEFGEEFFSPTNGIYFGHLPGQKPLYQDFREYCINQGERYVPTVKSFATQLRSAAKVMNKKIQSCRSNKIRGWKGIKVAIYET